ncbi:MAG: sigma-70 family RNA polymerase sigma factor [Clostridiales bacterium]|jgi:RNA polymerase sigma factor (sigma-70 family)|nr:sigma-70 family RNA polymerase sigma factor [Clostridiales bacterium]
MNDILLQRIKNKDKKAFEELYNRYAAYATRVALAITRRSDLAGDAVQETFIRVYFNIDKFQIGRPFEPWLYRILVNECNRILKQGKKVTYIGDYMDYDENFSHEDRRSFEEYEELYKAVDSLTDKLRIPVILKYLKGFKEAEIAEILDLNVNTVKSRLYKGRQKLKKALAGRNSSEEGRKPHVK